MVCVCQVCEQNESRYKCPACRAPYCSLACYKNHKAVPCGGETIVGSPTSGPVTSVDIVASEPIVTEPQSVGTDITTNHLSTERLSLLKESEFFVQQIKNPTIQALLVQIESSKDRMKALQQALLNAEFSNFMYKSLDEVESPK